MERITIGRNGVCAVFSAATVIVSLAVGCTPSVPNASPDCVSLIAAETLHERLGWECARLGCAAFYKGSLSVRGSQLLDIRPVPGHACNTVGIRKGRTNRRALFIAHTDTAPHTVGALDDGTGCALLLSLAERMRKACPDWSFEFLFTGGDEYPGPPGQPHACTAAYLKRHRPDNLEFFLEVDCVGNIHCPNQLLMALPDKAQTRLKQRLRGKDVYLEDYPDKGLGLSTPIFKQGISGMFLDSDYFLFIHIHTPADDMEVVSPRRLSEALDIAEASVRGLCSLPQGLLGNSRT